MSVTGRRFKRIDAVLLAFACSAVFASRLPGQSAPVVERRTVKVTGGELRGVVRNGVASFKGIPFAAPPVGELRWKAPQPLKSWDGVREADQFGPAPMQPPITAALFGGGAKPSEDCLYLNVWTAAKDPGERRPVMVWIYGGAYMMGATSAQVYDGAAFAEKGVVLVSVAYRVGPFGFLAHPELRTESGGKASGNFGLQDQIAGLRWVKENIARFGGDPSRVTIFGESAGGSSVSFLATSPAAKGLFHRVISESGVPFLSAISVDAGEERGKKFLAELGATDIRAARALSAEAIQNGKFEPSAVADDVTVADDAYGHYLRGEFHDTPLLVGSNSDDGGMFAPSLSSSEAFEKAVRERLGPGADPILAVYPHATKEEAARATRDAVRDMVFAWPAWAWAGLQAEKGKGKAYLYYFDYGSKPGGASHASELAYVFGNLGGLVGPSASAANKKTSGVIMSYWVNFAKNGDPNGPDLPQWTAFDFKTCNTMIFGKTIEVGPTPNLAQLKVVDTYYANKRQQKN